MLTYDLEGRGEESLYVHLYRCIRADIEQGAIAAGERLPSKRGLARHLGVSVITVEGAYAQLLAEGYISAQERRGYYACALPKRLALSRGPQAHADAGGVCGTVPGGCSASGRSQASAAWVGDVPGASVREEGAWTSSAPGVRAWARAQPLGSGTAVPGITAPAAEFDFSDGRLGEPEDAAALWGRAVRQALVEEPASELFADVPAAGHPRLRAAIAGHLRAFRGMEVDPRRVLVGAGAQLFYALIAQMLGPGARMAVEDPGYLRMARVYAAAGLDVAPVALDAQGIDVGRLDAAGAAAVHVMPSHQYPTGVVMGAARRFELLGWAAADGRRIVVEDDYDCEFRLSGRPVPALASADALGQVAYLNTFSKSLNSALRLAYVVLPPVLADRFRDDFGFYAATVSSLDQIVLARLIESGDYERRINRVRTRHRAVRDALVGALRSSGVAERLRCHGLDAGLHFVLEVEGGDVAAIERAAREQGVVLVPLSHHCSDPANLPAGNPCFVMQYGTLTPERAMQAAERLAAALA